MKLANDKWGFTIEFGENVHNELVIENVEELRETILMLNEQVKTGEGRFVLSKDNKTLDFKKKVDLILDPLIVDINDKRIVSKLYQNLAAEAEDEDHFLATREINSSIKKYVDDLLQSNVFPIEFNDETDMIGLFKTLDVRIDETSTGAVEKLIYYIELMREFCGIELFVCTNLKVYFTQEEVEALYKELEYEKINVLLLDSSLQWFSKHEKRYIIDKDLCEIY